MKAVRLNAWGQPVTVEEIEQPTAGPGEVLVRVRAAGVNKVDYFIAAGYMQGMLSVPRTQGTDFAGDVVAVGDGVTHVQPGDAVYGLIPMQGGAFAEYLVAQSAQVARKPQSLEYVQAAAVPLVALTAWQSLFDTAGVQAGERVLVHGAAGGVGSIATQLAKYAGAYVIGTAGADRAERLRELGADEHVDPQARPFEESVQDIDVVVDTVGGDVAQRSYGVLKPGGRLATPAAQIAPEEAEAQAQQRGIRVAGVWTQPNAEQLEQVAALIDAGKVKVLVSDVLPLEQAQEAQELVATGHPRGKVVLQVA
jgi:NADPH:quinone reductase-like Zn-dependent oxidoreductase